MRVPPRGYFIRLIAAMTYFLVPYRVTGKIPLGRLENTTTPTRVKRLEIMKD